ncbi:hypothetical protein LCGC14_0669490 [marine sediment metagenome]|uniref:Uncharacterized protein n=1 Tax=marine sediment metagenome TaxID=412755 RepID=A0A0F9QWI3_9ZZZZ|nr:hypothetical protein [Candidatus Aminicenantes bacterium]HEB36021.1 hypothetical protein [Candidatus Aminicenantes bacterium]
MSKLETENKILRRLLWLRHGCPSNALYGDDGELQCHNCIIDFKRISARALDKRFFELGMEKYEIRPKKKQRKKGRESRRFRFIDFSFLKKIRRTK